MSKPRMLEVWDSDNDFVEVDPYSSHEKIHYFLISVITRCRRQCNSVRITDAKDARKLAAKLNECAEWMEKSK